MEIQFSFIGMEVSDALRNYAQEKISKFDELLVPAISVTVDFKDNVFAKGVEKDFEIDIKVVLPKAVVRVKENGEDMYAVVDKSTDILGRRLKRYLDKRNNWEGETPWKAVEELQEAYEDVPDNYIDYVPKISQRKQVDAMPISEAEAIERMELLGEFQILFKNVKTNKISMVYKDSNGQYTIVELKDEV